MSILHFTVIECQRITSFLHRLAAHVLALRTGQVAQTQEELDKQAYATMWSLVKKYSETLEYHKPVKDANRPGQHTVVLTGATGALGAHIVAQLVSSPSVARVYALVRAKDDTNAAERVASSLKQRRVRTLKAEETAKIVSLASNIDKADLGLSPDRYTEIRNNATAVIAVGGSYGTITSVKRTDAGLLYAECLVREFQSLR